MTVQQLLDKVNYLAGKDKRGKTFKITEFNDLLPTVQDKLFNDELRKITTSDQEAISVQLTAISPLRVFMASTIVAMTDGVGTLPTNYRRFINLTANYREVSVISQTEFNNRRTSPFRRPDVNPVCYVTPYGVVMLPWGISVIELNYFKAPTTPYFDYCQDAETLNEIFMPVGSYIALEDTLYNLYNSDDEVIASDVTKDGVTFPYTSQTVELQWEAIYHDEFVLAILSLVGINLDKTELTQYAEVKK